MQHTPPRPTLQSQQGWAVRNLQVTQGYHSFISPIAGQPIEQGPYVADVYSLASLRDAVYSQPCEYKLFKVNIHVFFITGVHAFYSLRFERDFTIDAGKQRLLEAEQLNFWKHTTYATHKIHPLLGLPNLGVVQ